MKILRYPEDRWPLAYTSMVLAVQLGLFFAVESLWVTAVCVILFQPVQAVAIACNHYQHHINVFKVRWLNRVYETILFLQTGTPPYLITLHHNLGHHPHYLEPELDTLCWQRPGGSPRSLFECLVKNFTGHLTWTIALGRQYPRVYRRLKIMTVVSLLTLSVFLYLDPAKAMIVFVGPMLLAIFNVARLGYDQHAGLDLNDHLSASRNIESHLYNLVTFNSGYHTAHHVKPGLHWSKLPEFHRELRDQIPAELRGSSAAPAAR